MPKIRIKEADLTTNQGVAANSNVIFLKVTTSSTTTALDTPTFYADLDDTEKALIATTDKTFIEEAEALGGKVLVGKDYATVADYLKDRNQFDVKFLVVDAELEDSEDSDSDLEVSEDLQQALIIAQARKDCAVVLNAADTELDAETKTLLKASVNYANQDFYKDQPAEAKLPVGKYVLPFYAKTLEGSFANNAARSYILAYLYSIYNNNAEWLAIAGAKRGYIPGVKSVGLLTEDQIDQMQKRTYDTDFLAVNPIVKVNPWGIRVWGNRTALPNNSVEDQAADQLVADSFANIRILICDIKKALYKASRENQFEQNTDVLWVNFKSEVNALLEEMKQSSGIAGYRWTQLPSTERAKLKATLRIIPTEPVEDFDLTLELADSLEVAE